MGTWETSAEQNFDTYRHVRIYTVQTVSKSTYLHIYMYISICLTQIERNMCIHIYIRMYIEKERERERESVWVRAAMFRRAVS